MVILTGKNLGERHRELNYKVAEFFGNQKNFDETKIEEETSDIDKLYKIDIASQYKDVDYIVEVLKSGDSLYITRALKCLWLYDDEYKHIVNAEYLHGNVIPFMSIKMKKKLLSTISMQACSNDRGEEFYIYCKKNGMANIAFKFLDFASIEFKLNVLRTDKSVDLYTHIDKNLQHFVGNSFVLATSCIEMYDWRRINIIYNLRYLHTINSDDYLDILEKYTKINLENAFTSVKRFGIRISRDIMLKQKNRILKNPLLYVNILNKTILVKHSSQSEAKQYIHNLIPKQVKQFWKSDFCKTYDYILNLIPINERFEYIKQLFTTNYPGEDFEMAIYFYELKYYKLMSIDERELWALRHIEEQKEILGSGNDYMWYKFVNIDKALTEIKKYVLNTPDNDKRSSIVNILVEAARDQKDLKKVLDYYYHRHVNENELHKKRFIDKVLSVHNAFEFDIECWEALNKLFYSLDIYCVGKYSDKVYMALSVFCHILHNIDMPQALIQFVDVDVNYSYFSLLLEKLGKEKSEIVFRFLLKLFEEKLKPFEQDPYNKKLREKLKKYVNNIFNLLSCFQKDEECPEIVKNFMDIHSPKPKETKIITAQDLYSFLKTDATLAVEVLDNSDISIDDCSTVLNKVIRKLKVYFHNDVAQAYIKYLDRMILKSSDDYNSRKLINVAIDGILKLGDENFKVNLMEKYHPSEPKIDHSVIDRKLLCIREAICRRFGYSRPPVPLKNVLQYIKGDYVHYCLPMFNMYFANLPLPLLMKFIESILNLPLSVQKHGLRLAFKCYTSESLRSLLLSTWENTKNVSLRKIIYKSLFDKLNKKNLEEDEKHARIQFEVLKVFTSDLHQDDHDDLFELIFTCHCHLPNAFIDEFLQTAWNMVIKFPMKPVNIDRQVRIICTIDQNIKLVQRTFIRKSIIDENVHEMLQHRRLRPDELHNFQKLWTCKWNLTANYIVHYSDNQELEDSLALVSLIFKKCVDMWDDKFENTYVFQKFYFDFISYIENKCQSEWHNNLEDSFCVPIFQKILYELQESVPLKEIYLIVWNLKLTIWLQMSLSVTITALQDGDGNIKALSQMEILSDKIANHIESFVQELLDKQQYYPVYLREIAELIKYKLSNLNDMKNLSVILSESLTNIGLKETHLLALMILPVDVPEEMHEIHDRILKKIHEFENEEIQSFLHFKFLSTYYNKYSNGFLYSD